jgi:hypothetical protein
MADTRAQAYAAQLDLLTQQADALAPEARRRILALLRDLSREILADVARTAPSSYTAARLALLKSQVDNAMQQFSDAASAEVRKMEADVYRKTAVQVDATVTAGTGGVLVQPVIDTAALQVVQGYTADLIGGLTRDSAAKINAALQRAWLGRMDLAQLTAEIGGALEGGEFSGMFAPIAERALSIASNEILRIQSLASVARINAMAAHHPQVEKMWKHVPIARVPRISHELADGQVRKPGDPFLVAGEKLQYPRDPSGSAENTINCHCLVVPYVSEDLLKPTEGDRALLRSYGLSITAA